MVGLKIPEVTIARLSAYSKYLKRLEKKGIDSVSSGDIAQGVGVKPAQVRKDLSSFGEFGTRGVGYKVQDLVHYISNILGLTHPWNVILIGAGKVGSALVTYGEFKERGFNIVAVFDNDLTKIGKKIVDLEVMAVEQMPEIIERYDVQIAIIAVPPQYGQQAADMVVANNIKGILNFAPTSLNLPPDVNIQNVDLSASLESITYCITRGKVMPLYYM
ncbi:redox-sensing transcriptional repressor Rex [Peptococcaceae bacterium 1198_IL3148]